MVLSQRMKEEGKSTYFDVDYVMSCIDSKYCVSCSDPLTPLVSRYHFFTNEITCDTLHFCRTFIFYIVNYIKARFDLTRNAMQTFLLDSVTIEWLILPKSNFVLLTHQMHFAKNFGRKLPSILSLSNRSTLYYFHC